MTDDITAIVEINKAQMALERASSIFEMVELRDTFMAMQVLADAKGFKEAAQEAKIYQLKAERKAGQWLAENVRPGNPQLRQDDLIGKIPDGIDAKESQRWQMEAKVPEDIFDEWVDDCLATGKEITAAGLQRIAKGAPHVSFNSGNNEWYTPKEYIEAARHVMGEIDLDPASSDVANKTVKAKVYFTEYDNGLDYSWDGRVWMNPPYSGELIGKFTGKLAAHYSTGEVSEAIVLVNNATETEWYQTLLTQSSAVCFIKGRVKFVDVNGFPSGAPLQGQTVLYLGNNPGLFADEFDKFGIVLYAGKGHGTQ